MCVLCLNVCFVFVCVLCLYIADYCVTTVQNDKPDSVVIHIGSNSLYNDDTNEIDEDIFNVIQICRNYGVNEVFLSGITFRNRHLSKVRNLNNLLEMNEEADDYTFIKNDNIYAKDLGKDNLHLNFVGTTKIVNNILDNLNALHA